MPVKCTECNFNVVEAARSRIKNIFSNGCKVYMSFSCGKDSLCMSHVTLSLIESGEIDPSQLYVVFIDEEGLYPSMVDAAERWRKIFIDVGAKFLWFCLPFKQVCTIDHLSASESWITWEPGKEDVWMRDPPPYAIMQHPALHYPGEMNYQTFCRIAFRDGIQMVGLRASESIQRLKAIAASTEKNMMYYPIYDWHDWDIWMYIRDNNLEFPEIYIRLYEAGVKKRNLRLCCFFGDSSTQGLRWVAETDHALWDRIMKREPNAYLALLYWDSEMFGRDTQSRKKLESDYDEKDYKALCADLLFINTSKYNIAPDTYKNLKRWRSLFLKISGIATNNHYKKIYEGILYGDPKGRTYRGVYSKVFNEYVNTVKNE